MPARLPADSRRHTPKPQLDGLFDFVALVRKAPRTADELCELTGLARQTIDRYIAGAAPIEAARAYQINAMAFRLANAAVIADLRTYSHRLTLGGLAWWDTRPWLDEREHAAESIDMARLAIDYAVTSGLAMRHPQQPHLLHLLAVADHEGMAR